MPSFRISPARLQQLATEHDSWLRRLSAKYATPRALLCRQLAGPGVLEYEIALLIAEAARATAQRLIADRAWPPDGADLWDRAVAGCWQQLRDAQYAASEHQTRQLLDSITKDSL